MSIFSSNGKIEGLVLEAAMRKAWAGPGTSSTVTRQRSVPSTALTIRRLGRKELGN